MKKFLSILSLSACYSFGQNTFFVSAGTDNNDWISSVIQTPDGYIGAGYTEKNDLNGDAYIFKIDYTGHLVWNKTINIFNSDGAEAIIKTADGGFAVTGFSGSNISSDAHMAILKFDASGTLQWIKQYDEGSGAIGTKLLQTEDKGFLIAGDYKNPGSLGYLIKTDSSGNFTWSKKFNVGSFNDLRKTTDHNYILLSGRNDDSSTSIIKVDTAGNILWSKTFIDSSYYPFNGNAILPVENGGYLITGLADDGFILNTDADGNILWSKLIKSENAYISLDDGVEISKDNFVLAGSFGSIIVISHAYYLIKIDNDGILAWTKTFSNGQQFYAGIADVIGTDNGEYLGVGYGESNSEDGVFVKFDSDFNTCQPTVDGDSLQDFNVFNKNLVISAVSGQAVSYTGTATISSAGSATNICNALPVSLTSFTANKNKTSVVLNWQTANEQNNAFFAIERSNNGNNNFKEAGRVNSKGNSTRAQQYSFEDFNPLSGKNYYRLKQVDKDGKITYSKVVSIDFDKLIAIKLYPNPVNDALNLEGLNANGKTTISLIDMQGRLLAKTTATSSTYTWQLKQLPAGNYYVNIQTDKQVTTLKFVKE